MMNSPHFVKFMNDSNTKFSRSPHYWQLPSRKARISNLWKINRIAAALIFLGSSATSSAQSQTDLYTLGGSISIPLAVSANGAVIVGVSTLTGVRNDRAFKYANGTMTDLGTLGGANSGAEAVSADGSVIVGVSFLAGDMDSHAFKYVNGTMTDLGTLGGTFSWAHAISADGLVIVGDTTLNGNSVYRAFKYVNGTMTDLGTLGGNYTYANAVSASGAVIVGRSSLSGDVDTHAFKYSNGTMTDLGSLGGTYSGATAISANGAVIVGTGMLVGNTVYHAFKYENGTMTDLGTLGGTFSDVYAVSANGAVIVGYSDLTGDTATHAFKYTNGTMTSLGTLGGNYSGATAVSASGAVIVGASTLAGDTVLNAFKYMNGTMTKLGTLGGAHSQATLVSADGSVIVGKSDTASGESHAFMYRNVMIDIPNTFAALDSSSRQLTGLMNAQQSLLNVALNDECHNFGQRDTCVSVGSRYTDVTGAAAFANASVIAATLQLGYRLSPRVRLGAFADQAISTASPGNYTVVHARPLMGAYATYTPSGGTLGLQLKASVATGSNDVSVTRSSLVNTEAGQGHSKVMTQGVQFEAAYGLMPSGRWQASPFAGIKTTRVVRDAYSETAGVDFPATLNAVSHQSTTSYAGIQTTGALEPSFLASARLGVEHDLHSKFDGYSGTMDFLGPFALAAPTLQRTRAFAFLQGEYLLSAGKWLSLALHYNRQLLAPVNGVTLMLRYSAAL